MATKTRFAILEDPRPELTERTAPTPSEPQESAALAVAVLVLQALSTRVTAWLAGHTLPLVSLGIAVFLWVRVMDDPTPNQLVGLGLYATFALLVLLLRSARA